MFKKTYLVPPAPAYALRARDGTIPCHPQQLRPYITRLHKLGYRVGAIRVVSPELGEPAPAGRRHYGARTIDADYRVVDEWGVVRPDLEPHFMGTMAPYWNRAADADATPWSAEVRPRGLPIAGTGRGRYRGRHWKHIAHTQAERRASCALEWEEGEVHIRARRNAVHLPSSWDESPRVIERSWKRHRKTQWNGGGAF